MIASLLRCFLAYMTQSKFPDCLHELNAVVLLANSVRHSSAEAYSVPAASARPGRRFGIPKAEVRLIRSPLPLQSLWLIVGPVVADAGLHYD